MKPYEMDSHYPRPIIGSCTRIPLEPSEKRPRPRPIVLICELVPYFSPAYVTTKQKADTHNSFQVIVRTNTHRKREAQQTSTERIIYACVHDNCMTI